MTILVVSGSLREGSLNTALARAAVEHAPEGVRVELYPSLASLPLFDDDHDRAAAPAPVRDLRSRIAAADAVLFVTPEYNGSVSGVLKNAVDWASRPARAGALTGKTVAVAGATPGAYGAVWAQGDLRRILGIAGARVLDADFPVAKAHERLDPERGVLDPALGERLTGHLAALAALTAPQSVTAEAA